MALPVPGFLVLTVLSVLSLQWVLVCVAEDSHAPQIQARDTREAPDYMRFRDDPDKSGALPDIERRFKADLAKSTGTIFSDKRYSAFSGGKRFSGYSTELGKRPAFNVDLGKRFRYDLGKRDGSKRYRIDLGKRADEVNEDAWADPDKRYNFDLGKRYNFDLGKRYNFDLGKRYNFDLGKRYNFDLGKRDELADEMHDEEKRFSGFRVDMGKRHMAGDVDEKRFRYDLGKRSDVDSSALGQELAFDNDENDRYDKRAGFNVDLGKRATSGNYDTPDIVSYMSKKPMYRIDMGKRAADRAQQGKRYNFDLGKRSYYDWKRLFRTDLGK